MKDGVPEELESFVIDTSVDPHKITITKLDDSGKPTKEVQKGIYKIDGKKMTVAISMKDHPKEFKPQPNTTLGDVVAIMTLEKTEAKAPEYKKPSERKGGGATPRSSPR